MSFEALRVSIESRMNTYWSTTVVAYENVPFSPPDTPWIRLTVLVGTGETSGHAGDGTTVEVRDTGVISIQVFVPEGSGTALSKQYVDSLIAIYEHTRFDGILAYTASPVPVGVNNGWHQTNITIPFRRARNV